MASLLAMAELSESTLACTGVAGLLAAYALISTFRCGPWARAALRGATRAAVRHPADCVAPGRDALLQPLSPASASLYPTDHCSVIP
jgi:hypothetical protein